MNASSISQLTCRFHIRYRFSFPGADLWRACPGADSCAARGVTETVTFARVQQLLAAQPTEWAQLMDAAAGGAPYAVRHDRTAFITYDTRASTTAKVRFAIAHGVGGSFAWEVSQDWMPSGSDSASQLGESAHPLIDAMARGAQCAHVYVCV